MFALKRPKRRQKWANGAQMAPKLAPNFGARPQLTFISIAPRSKSLLNRSSTVGLYLVSNFLNRNLFKMEVLLRCFGARKVSQLYWCP